MTTSAASDDAAPALLVAAAESVFAELGWQRPPEPSGLSILVGYTGEHGAWNVVVEAFEDEPLLLVYSLAPDLVDEPRLAAVVEYLARVNDGLPRANLEIDLTTGLVRCRTALDVEGVDAPRLAREGFLVPLVRRVVRANVVTMDLVLPGLEAVVAGRVTPEEADAAIGA